MTESKYLFPRYFRWIGFFLLVISIVGFAYLYLSARMNNILPAIFRQINDAEYPSWIELPAAFVRSFGDKMVDEFVLLGFTLSLMFIAFTREKIEDEYVGKVRRESLLWAIMVDAVTIVLAVFLLFNIGFVVFMAFNFYLILILYTVKFRMAMHRFHKLAKNEK